MLLKQAGIDFEVIASDCDEDIEENIEPQEIVLNLAERKGKDVLKKVLEKNKEDIVIISADTIVYGNHRVYGKPISEENALEMLLELSEKEHSVFTGVCIINYANGKKNTISFYEETKVKMKKIDKSEAKEYIATGEPMDKAGAYAIQGKGALLVSKIDGDFYNVVGLPLCKLCHVLHNNIGI